MQYRRELLKTDNKINKKINQLARSGQIQKAIEYCQSLLIKEPSNTALCVRLGDLYMDWHLDVYQAKQYIDEAITQYQRASESLIDDPSIYYKIGFAFYHKGELDRAINYFNLALGKGANKAQCHYMIAQSLKKKDRYHDALDEANEALKHTFLRSSRIHYLKYRLLKALFFKSTKTKIESYINLILSVLTLPFDSEAIKNVANKAKIITVFPALVNAYKYYALKDFDKAIGIYSEAIDKMPGFAPLYSLLGDVYRAVGKHEEAIVEYKMARWIDSLCFSAYSGLVQAYEEMGDYDNAIITYKKFISIHPNNAVLHSNVANLYFMKGEIDEAISHYQSAITLNPKQDWTSLVAQTLGYIQQNVTKNMQAAVSSFHIAHLLAPKEIDIYVSLGSAFYDAEDYKNALIVYRRALELEPNNAKIHCNMGYLYWGMGDLTEAIKEYNLSIKYDPHYDIAHNNLGVIYLDDLAHISNAIECFKHAAESNPNYALAYYNLGRAYAIKGEKIEAAKYYQLAYDVNSITEEIDPAEIQERLNNLFD